MLALQKKFEEGAVKKKSPFLVTTEVTRILRTLIMGINR